MNIKGVLKFVSTNTPSIVFTGKLTNISPDIAVINSSIAKIVFSNLYI